MNSFRQVVQDAARLLEDAGVPSPSVDATELLNFVMSSGGGVVGPFDAVTMNQIQDFQALVDKRCDRIPLQHLTGVAYFRHLTLQVGAGVFSPRPETELLAQVGVDVLKSGMTAVDLCSGSGAVALALATEVAGVSVHAVEMSADACEFLTQNVARYSSTLAENGSTVTVYLADAMDSTVLAHLFGRCDVVLSNPPYIPSGMIPREPEVRDHDPDLALYGGLDGFDIARGVIEVAAGLLVSGGVFGMEHADVQGESVGELFDTRWTHVNDHTDYNLLPRYVTAVRSSAKMDAS